MIDDFPRSPLSCISAVHPIAHLGAFAHGKELTYAQKTMSNREYERPEIPILHREAASLAALFSLFSTFELTDEDVAKYRREFETYLVEFSSKYEQHSG